MAKVGAPYGNKNAAGKGGTYKSGKVTIVKGSAGDRKIKRNFVSMVKKQWK